MPSEGSFPRTPSRREIEWLDFLLPAERPGYRPLRERLRTSMVIGEGRWGAGDLVFGMPEDEIDLTEGMQPVVSYGEVNGCTSDDRRFIITLSLHQPNEEGLVEFQIGAEGEKGVPDEFRETSRWSYSYWSPGAPCPATGASVREVPLNPQEDMLLVISPVKRVIWIHDRHDMTNTLIPVTNFYNELMLLKGIRDPDIALDHKRLFTELGDFTSAELRGAFVRYNLAFRKIDPDRVAGEKREDEDSGGSMLGRIVNLFRGRKTS